MYPGERQESHLSTVWGLGLPGVQACEEASILFHFLTFQNKTIELFIFFFSLNFNFSFQFFSTELPFVNV